MLNRLTVRGFKSLADVTVDLPRFAVLFGPNATGKSNLLDAIQALSWLARAPTLSDALGGPFPVRGRSGARRRSKLPTTRSTFGERDAPAQGCPRKERLGLNHSILSDRSLSGNGYAWLDNVRDEFAGWRTYHFEPRLVRRQDESPMDVTDIGIHGHNLAAFLYKLKATQPQSFEAIARVLRTIVPGVEAMDIELDERRGILDLQIRQDGTSYSSRVLSEGTLRLLAMCAIAVNPWAGSVVALEEPENGVHPRRIDVIARLLVSLSEREQRQVIVTTHSPLFVDAVLKLQSEDKVEGVGLFNVRLFEGKTLIKPFDPSGPLLKDQEIAADLVAQMDLYKAGKNDSSLGAFIADMRTRYRRASHGG